VKWLYSVGWTECYYVASAICFRYIPVSNLGPQTDRPHWDLSRICSVRPGKCWCSSLKRPWRVILHDSASGNVKLMKLLDATRNKRLTNPRVNRALVVRLVTKAINSLNFVAMMRLNACFPTTSYSLVLASDVNKSVLKYKLISYPSVD
jgi:hypothetical protein